MGYVARRSLTSSTDVFVRGTALTLCRNFRAVRQALVQTHGDGTACEVRGEMRRAAQKVS